MKYKKYYLSALLLLNSFSHTAYSSDPEDNTEEFDEFDNFFDESGEFDFDTSALRNCEPGEADQWVDYLSLLSIPEIFNEDFYKSTNIPNYRNVINYPNFFTFSYQPTKEQQVTFHTFYNQSFKKHYTNDSSKNNSCKKSDFDGGQRLGSYLNIENGTFFNVIKKDIDAFGPLLPASLEPVKNINFPAIFTILGNSKLEERRLGFMAHYYKEINDKTSFEVTMPLLYEIRNLNFSNAEKEELEKQFSVFLGSSDSTQNGGGFDEVAFGKQHLIMDAFGSGTLDIALRHKIYEGEKTRLDLGFSLYAPTDRRWTTGLYGTYFEPKDQQPFLRLCDLVRITATPPALEPNAKDLVEKYFLSALDHLSSAILQCPLGYDNHLGFALKAMPYWQIRDDLQFSSVYLFEYLFAHERPRFFIPKQSETPFLDQFNNAATNEERLDLLERKLTERLFPRVFTTTVTPGFIFNTISNLQWSRKEWNFTIGYNAWYKSEEKLKRIKAPEDVVNTLNITKATAGSASQVKIYGKIHRKFETTNHNISFSIYGNATVWNSNLANDITLGISFDKAF